MTQPVFCHHPNAVQTAEEHPGGVSTYLREHRGHRHRVKRRYTEPMVLVERRCPDCPAYAASTVQPSANDVVLYPVLHLAPWIVGERETWAGMGVAPGDLGPWLAVACGGCGHRRGVHIGIPTDGNCTDPGCTCTGFQEIRDDLCGDCGHGSKGHHQNGCIGNRNLCFCMQYKHPSGYGVS